MVQISGGFLRTSEKGDTTSSLSSRPPDSTDAAAAKIGYTQRQNRKTNKSPGYAQRHTTPPQREQSYGRARLLRSCDLVLFIGSTKHLSDSGGQNSKSTPAARRKAKARRSLSQTHRETARKEALYLASRAVGSGGGGQRSHHAAASRPASHKTSDPSSPPFSKRHPLSVLFVRLYSTRLVLDFGKYARFCLFLSVSLARSGSERSGSEQEHTGSDDGLTRLDSFHCLMSALLSFSRQQP